MGLLKIITFTINDSYFALPSKLVKEVVDYDEEVKDLFTGKNWCGKSIKQRAQAISFEQQYDIVYSYLSILHHPGFAGMLVNIKHGDRKVLFDVGPNEQLLTLVLPASYGYFVDFLEYFREAFALGGEKEIQELSRRIKELIE